MAVVVMVIVSFLLGSLWWRNYQTADRLADARGTAEFQTLIGRWQRPDGGYVIEIKSIAANGAIDAGYFNPRSIHVAKAEASRDGDALRVFVELRDVNYPGSSYTLIYDPAADRFTGTYYQAVQKQRFPVAFVRVK